MPYVRCPSCRLAAYTASRYSSRDRCPRCGGALPGADESREQGAPGEPIRRALALARDQLGMDPTMLTEVRDNAEVIRNIVGDSGWLGVSEHDSFPLEETYCKRLLEGRIGSIVADAQRDDRVLDLAMTVGAGIGAYIGVPLRVDEARLYVLCCFAREARPALGEADVHFLRGLGETVMAELNGAA